MKDTLSRFQDEDDLDGEIKSRWRGYADEEWRKNRVGRTVEVKTKYSS